MTGKVLNYTSIGIFLIDCPEVTLEEALADLEATTTTLVRESTEEAANGVLAFHSTTTPVAALFEFLAAGNNVPDFFWEHPEVRKQDVNAVLTAAPRILELLAQREDTTATSVNVRYPGGTCEFAGTTTPVHALFDMLLKGQSPKDFIHQFYGGTRENVQAVLREAGGAAEQVGKNTPN